MSRGLVCWARVKAGGITRLVAGGLIFVGFTLSSTVMESSFAPSPSIVGRRSEATKDLTHFERERPSLYLGRWQDELLMRTRSVYREVASVEGTVGQPLNWLLELLDDGNQHQAFRPPMEMSRAMRTAPV